MDENSCYDPKNFIQIDGDAYGDAYKTISFTDDSPQAKEFRDTLVWWAVEAKIDWLLEHSDLTFEELKMYVERKKIPFYIKEKLPD